jgi:ATP-binding cassette, subfamily B, bacterial
VIAHRLSTVRAADRIVVLQAGRVQAFGRHEALLRECALYQDLASTELVATEPLEPDDAHECGSWQRSGP